MFCIFASSNLFPPLFHVIYCKRLGLFRLGVSVHINNNDDAMQINTLLICQCAWLKDHSKHDICQYDAMYTVDMITVCHAVRITLSITSVIMMPYTLLHC